MSFVRARALRGLQNGMRSGGTRPALRQSAARRTQVQARRYASSEGGHGGAHESKSDLPWILGSVIVTPPACWYLWPSASDDHHDSHDDHKDDHKSEEKEEDAPEEDDSAPKEEEAPKDDESAKSEDEPSDEGEDKGDGDKDDKKDDKEEEKSNDEGESKSDDKSDDKPEESKSKDSSEDKSKGSGVNSKGKLQSDSDGASDTRKTESDSKGEKRKRIDSGLQKNLGPGSGEEDGSKRDYTTQEGKQQGLSNTQTRHSTPIHTDPEKSKKADGTPETAKTMGTVDPRK